MKNKVKRNIEKHVHVPEKLIQHTYSCFPKKKILNEREQVFLYVILEFFKNLKQDLEAFEGQSAFQ